MHRSKAKGQLGMDFKGVLDGALFNEDSETRHRHQAVLPGLTVGGGVGVMVAAK